MKKVMLLAAALLLGCSNLSYSDCNPYASPCGMYCNSQSTDNTISSDCTYPSTWYGGIQTSCGITGSYCTHRYEHSATDGDPHQDTDFGPQNTIIPAGNAAINTVVPTVSFAGYLEYNVIPDSVVQGVYNYLSIPSAIEATGYSNIADISLTTLYLCITAERASSKNLSYYGTPDKWCASYNIMDGNNIQTTVAKCYNPIGGASLGDYNPNDSSYSCVPFFLSNTYSINQAYTKGSSNVLREYSWFDDPTQTLYVETPPYTIPKK